jgi:hypothetical protein
MGTGHTAGTDEQTKVDFTVAKKVNQHFETLRHGPSYGGHIEDLRGYDLMKGVH